MADYKPKVSPVVASATADLISEIANIELTLNFIIWRLLDVPAEYGRPLSARLDIRPKSEIIISLLSRRKKQRERFKRYSKRIEAIVPLRNKIVHGGGWISGEDNQYVHFVSAKTKHENPYYLSLLPIPLSEIQDAAMRAARLNFSLSRFSFQLKPLPRKPRARSPNLGSNRPLNPARKKTKARRPPPRSSRV